MKTTGITIIFLALTFSEEILAAWPKCLDIPREAEISISGIYLSDAESAVSVLGKKINITEIGDEFPTARYCGRNGDQLLTLTFHYGSPNNSFNEIKVSRSAPATCEDLPRLDEINHFTSGKGIELGISKAELVNILGQGTESNEIGKTVVSYYIDQYEKSRFLQFYKLPTYYGEYIFLKNRLVQFSFGFEYP